MGGFCIVEVRYDFVFVEMIIRWDLVDNIDWWVVVEWFGIWFYKDIDMIFVVVDGIFDVVVMVFYFDRLWFFIVVDVVVGRVGWVFYWDVEVVKFYMVEFIVFGFFLGLCWFWKCVCGWCCSIVGRSIDWGWWFGSVINGNDWVFGMYVVICFVVLDIVVLVL